MHFVKLCINAWWEIGECWPQTSISKSWPADKRSSGQVGFAFGIKCEKNFKCVQLLKSYTFAHTYTLQHGHTPFCRAQIYVPWFFSACVCGLKFWPSNSWQSSHQAPNPCPLAAFQANVLNPLALATAAAATAAVGGIVVVVVCCLMTNAFVYPNIILLWLMRFLLAAPLPHFFLHSQDTARTKRLYIFVASLYDISNNSVQTSRSVGSALLTCCQHGLCSLILSSRLLCRLPSPGAEVFMLR